MGVTVAGSSNGTSGSALSLLNATRGFDIDINQTLYIADVYNGRIVRWPRGASSGTVVAGQTSTFGPGTNLLDHPLDVKLVSNSLYVVEYYNYRAVRWTLGASSGSIIVGGMCSLDYSRSFFEKKEDQSIDKPFLQQ